MAVNVSVPPVDGAVDEAGVELDDVEALLDAEIANGMLPFAAGLS